MLSLIVSNYFLSEYLNEQLESLHEPSKKTLFGHSEAISGCAISTELDMAVSASGDGVTNIYTVRKGVFIRTLQATNQSISAIPSVTLSRDGYILFPAISKDQVSFKRINKNSNKICLVGFIPASVLSKRKNSSR